MEKACRTWLPSHRTESHKERRQLLGMNILYFNVIFPFGGHQSFFILCFFPLPSLVLFPTLLSFFPMWADFPGKSEIHCRKRRSKVAKLAIDFSLECQSVFCGNSDRVGQNFLLRYLCYGLSFLNWLLTDVTYQNVTCNNMFLLFLFSELLIPIILDLLFTLHQFQGMNPKLSIQLESPKQVRERSLARGVCCMNHYMYFKQTLPRVLQFILLIIPIECVINHCGT